MTEAEQFIERYQNALRSAEQLKPLASGEWRSYLDISSNFALVAAHEVIYLGLATARQISERINRKSGINDGVVDSNTFILYSDLITAAFKLGREITQALIETVGEGERQRINDFLINVRERAKTGKETSPEEIAQLHSEIGLSSPQFNACMVFCSLSQAAALDKEYYQTASVMAAFGNQVNLRTIDQQRVNDKESYYLLELAGSCLTSLVIEAVKEDQKLPIVKAITEAFEK